MFNAPAKIPEVLLDEYTMSGTIPVIEKYYNECYGDRNYYWPVSAIEELQATHTPQNYIEGKIKGLDNKLAKKLIHIAEEHTLHEKSIAVLGCQIPWVECLFSGMNNDVTSIRTKPALNSETYNTTMFDDFEQSDTKYDVIISHNSTEHAGLGRYGDTLDPAGDVREMRAAHKNLTDDGLLIWVGSVGTDSLIWNSNRVYGTIGLEKLFKGFIETEWCYKTKQQHTSKELGEHEQAVVLLEKAPEYNV